MNQNNDSRHAGGNPAAPAGGFTAAVPELISLQVQRSGNACALRCGAQELSYEEFDARAGDLAAQLAARGVAGRAVALLLPRSIDLIVAMVAAQKAGAWFVPVEPAQPDARIAFLLEDCNPAVVIGRASLPAFALAREALRLSLDDEPAQLAQPRPVPLAPDDAVYAIYTSGTTGQPKAALNYQKGVVNLYTWTARELELGAQTRSLVIGSLSFDLYHKAVFAPLLSGGCVVLYEPAVFDPAEIRALVASERIDFICATPSAFNALLENAGEAGMAQLASLRVVALGGEVVSKPRLRPWFSHPACSARVINTFGPTECADIQTYHWITPQEMANDEPVPIGVAIPDCEVYVLNDEQQPLPPGQPGRLWLGGVCVGGGYLNRPEKTAQAFVPNPFRRGERMYDTGDLACWNAQGELEYRGRADRQVKINGYRIELDEVEAALAQLPGVAECAATAPADEHGERRLKAWLRLAEAREAMDLRRELAARVPAYLVPQVWNVLERFPYTTSGKIDRKALEAGAAGTAQAEPGGETLEQRIAARWRELLGAEPDADASFFEIGGTSVLAVRFVGRLAKDLDVAIPMADFFAAATVNRFAAYLRERHAAAVARWTGEAPVSPKELRESRRESAPGVGPIAVVGMACRVPGADDVATFWSNIERGVDSVQKKEATQPGFVAASGWIEHADTFDHEFFRYTPREAAITDPQQRILLECAWHALEHAGISPQRADLEIGVYAGLAANSYLTRNLATHAEFRDYGMDYSSIGNDKDYAATRIAYKLGLRGPAVTVQTACSSSGTALHLACQGLQTGDCDAAIVGGAALPWRYQDGYMFLEDGPLSRDGRVRSFDAQASGMVLSGGTACVVLKRLADAQADGDTIYSVIRATAINNDGGDKAAFTAPNPDGQRAVIRRALARAQVQARDIGYVEAHGTGTPLGDPIEIAALSRVYREQTQEQGWCAIGSVKGNIGHLDAAAACASLIKASLALKNRRLPAQPHFEQPHPECAMEASPFQVNRESVDWSGVAPLHAALSSFGFGGTNFHAILEEPPAQVASTPSGRRWHVLRLSAANAPGLEAQAQALSAWRAENPEASLADAAWTLDVGRARLRERGAMLVEDGIAPAMLIRASSVRAKPGLVWVFPGQGSQHPRMGAGLYREDAVFREAADRCAAVLHEPLGYDLRTLMFGGGEDDAAKLRDTGAAQPAIFTISYALAKMWQSRGHEPAAMLGHSVGEFVAATLAGVFELDDVLRLIARRAQLMRDMPRGGMLAVRMAETELAASLPPQLDLAAINAPQLCVVSGPQQAVDAFAQELALRETGTVKLHTSHAFHSSMMDAVVPQFREAVAACKRKAPARQILSSVTGRWMSAQEAADPEYWAQQLRRPVRFAPAVQALLATPGRVLLEVGPGQALAGAMRQAAAGQDAVVVSSLPAAQDEGADDARHAAEAMARLWIAGVEADPARYYAGERRNRIALPGYPFARVRHWIEPAALAAAAPAKTDEVRKQAVAPAPAQADEPPVQRQVLEAIRSRSGIALAGADLDRNFIELGFDSLLLTQITAQLKQVFNTDLRFRQLLRELATPRALIAHLQGNAPVVETRVADAAPIELKPSARAGARLGRDAEGNPAWFVPDPQRAGAYVQLGE